jgi:hypothetical protein
VRVDDLEVDIVGVAVGAGVLEHVEPGRSMRLAEDGVGLDRDHPPVQRAVEGAHGQEVGPSGADVDEDAAWGCGEEVFVDDAIETAFAVGLHSA